VFGMGDHGGKAALGKIDLLDGLVRFFQNLSEPQCGELKMRAEPVEVGWGQNSQKSIAKWDLGRCHGSSPDTGKSPTVS
jgi:hypothetical protein